MTAFYKYSAAEISNGIKQKQFTARDVIESALSRLDSVNPSINAVIDTYHGDALANADRIDHCIARDESCLLYTSPSPRDGLLSRMPSSA